MREFFYNLLQNLDKLTGMKQYEKLMQMDNYKQEINSLLDILCRVTDQFTYIPEEDKKRIIQDAVIADQEFIGLNAKIVSKWLNQKKDIFFKELAHQEGPEFEPLTGEERQKRLDEWQQAFNSIEVNFTSEKPYKIIREQWKPKEGTPIYQPARDTSILANHQRHLDWVKANYDARTAKPLDNWMPEEEWIRKQDL